MKYDFEMEVDPSTSVGKMVAQIKENSTVLEFGPGNGRMTKYLMEEKNCDVSIVELDQELYTFVRTFASDSFFGNIEEEAWCAYFEGKTFDYILFADVLEHLMQPKRALEKVLPFLKEDGQILITFPNLAHNSVLIDLFNNKLTWRETGLLDATHKSFFLQAGFEQLFDEVGLFIAKEDFTFNEVGYNEIDASYDDLPVEVRYAFQTRPYGEVYQYFFALTTQLVADPVRVMPENVSQWKTMHVAIEEEADNQQEFDIRINNVTGENKTFVIDVPEATQMLKLFPSLTGVVLDLQVTMDEEMILPTATNAIIAKEGHYLFCDYQVPVLEFQQAAIHGKTLQITVDYTFEGNYSAIENELIAYALEEKENVLREKEETERKLAEQAKRKWRFFR